MPKPPRKKACRSCTAAKARCDHQRPSCSRCQHRGLSCAYNYNWPEPMYNRGVGSSAPASDAIDVDDGHVATVAVNSTRPAPVSNPAPVTHNTHTTIPLTPSNWPYSDSPQNDELLFADCFSLDLGANAPVAPPLSNITPQDSAGSAPSGERDSDGDSDCSQELDFSGVRLICTVDCERVKSRWLQPWLSDATPRPKKLSPCTLTFIFAILRSYPDQLAGPGRPPFVHAKQLVRGKLPTPLANCASIAHMWRQRVPGSEGMVRKIITQEMKRLFSERSKPDLVAQLADFQAFLLLALMLLPTDVHQLPLLQQNVQLELQEYASTVANGLVSPAEAQGLRPPWESWIVGECRRRAVVVQYILDDLVNLCEGRACVTGEELGRLPITSGKALWNAGSAAEWCAEYDRDMSRGATRMQVADLWRQGHDPVANDKVTKWLSTVDELGMAIFAIANDAHAKK